MNVKHWAMAAVGAALTVALVRELYDAAGRPLDSLPVARKL